MDALWFALDCVSVVPVLCCFVTVALQYNLKFSIVVPPVSSGSWVFKKWFSEECHWNFDKNYN